MCGEGNGTPLQFSCLENPMGRGAWWAAVHGVTNSQTQLSTFTFTFHFHALERAMATHSSVLAWRIPGTGEPGGLLSMGPHRVGHNWSDLVVAAAAAAAACTFCGNVNWYSYYGKQNGDSLKTRNKATIHGDDIGWDGWMASLIQWTWVWANSGRLWRIGKPSMLQFMGFQRVRHDWAIEQQQYIPY